MKIFFVGIKGVGVCGLATLYKGWGYDVVGSDTTEEFFTDHILRELGILLVDFGIEHITKDIDTVVHSSAYGADHPQIARARELGIKTQTYSESLAEVFNARRGIVVTGTHGKTTSAAMLGRVLEDAGLDPTVVVGGELIEWGRTARAQLGNQVAQRNQVASSRWMVAEGDEYQAKFLDLKPYAVLLTNMEYDHPDFFKDEEAYRDAFRKLLKNVPTEGIVVAHENLRDFIATIYSRSHTTSPRIHLATRLPSLTGLPSLKVWGEHNRANAAGVLAMARALGVADDISLKALANFRGTKRRMELYTDENADIVVMDDYAHHPTEIRATLSALREHYPGRTIIAIFQPHTYSRTRALFNDFASAFYDADYVILVEIYASAREKEKSTSTKELFEMAVKNHPHMEYARDLNEAYDKAQAAQKSNSIVVTLGAGDVWHVARRLVN